MNVATAHAGALICDSLPFSTGGTAKLAGDLKTAGVDCLVGYLGAMTPERVGHLHDAGIAFMPVTFGTAPTKYNGPQTVAQCHALGLPSGCSVWLDLEGKPAFYTDPATLIAAVTAWRDAVAAAGFLPCLYVGVPQPLTSAEMTALAFGMYWHGQGEVRDRRNVPAAPDCGWTMLQKWPTTTRGGVPVDDNSVRPDALGRLPVWVVGDDPMVYSPDIVHPIVDLTGEPPDDV